MTYRTLEDVQLYQTIKKHGSIVTAQNEHTGELEHFYKIGKSLIDMETLKKADDCWIEQPRYMSLKSMMMYICCAGSGSCVLRE